MKKFVFVLLLMPFTVFGQVPIQLMSGRLVINDGSFRPEETKYLSTADSLSKVLVKTPKDTTALFEIAFLLDYFNSQLYKPAFNREAFNKLSKAKSLLKNAQQTGMKDLRLTVLEAQIDKDLCYQLAIQEKSLLSNPELTNRKAQFDSLKLEANRLYEKAKKLFSDQAYDLEKQKVNFGIN